MNPSLAAGYIGPEVLETTSAEYYHQRIEWIRQAAGDAVRRARAAVPHLPRPDRARPGRGRGPTGRRHVGHARADRGVADRPDRDHREIAETPAPAAGASSASPTSWCTRPRWRRSRRWWPRCRDLAVAAPAARASGSSGAPSIPSTPPTWRWPRRCERPSRSTACCWWWPTSPGRRRGSARSPRPRTATPWSRRPLAGWPGLEPCRIEIDRGGPSYTIDTVRQLHQDDPGAELVLVVGSDVVAGLTTWQDEPALRGLVTLAVVGRPGAPPAEPPPGWRAVTVPVAPLDVSSTELRRRLEAGEPVDGLVPEAVIRCIRAARSVRYEADDRAADARPSSGTPDGSEAAVSAPVPAGRPRRVDRPGAPPTGARARQPGARSATGPHPERPAQPEPDPARSTRADRQTQRAARRTPPAHLALACAAGGARVCLVLTILIVIMARNRNPRAVGRTLPRPGRRPAPDPPPASHPIRPDPQPWRPGARRRPPLSSLSATPVVEHDEPTVPEESHGGGSCRRCEVGGGHRHPGHGRAARAHRRLRDHQRAELAAGAGPSWTRWSGRYGRREAGRRSGSRGSTTPGGC